MQWLSASDTANQVSYHINCETVEDCIRIAERNGAWPLACLKSPCKHIMDSGELCVCVGGRRLDV